MTFQDMLDRRAIELHDRECGDRTCTPDTMGKWYHIARSEAIIRDGQALDNLARIISENEWNSDMMEPVMTEIVATGREIKDLYDADDVV